MAAGGDEPGPHGTGDSLCLALDAQLREDPLLVILNGLGTYCEFSGHFFCAHPRGHEAQHVDLPPGERSASGVCRGRCGLQGGDSGNRRMVASEDSKETGERLAGAEHHVRWRIWLRHDRTGPHHNGSYAGERADVGHEGDVPTSRHQDDHVHHGLVSTLEAVIDVGSCENDFEIGLLAKQLCEEFPLKAVGRQDGEAHRGSDPPWGS